MGQISGLQKVKVVNCTPHVINLLTEDSYMFSQIEPKVRLSFPTSKYVARATYQTGLVDRLIVDNTVIDVTSTRYTNVVGLPLPEEGTIFIVSKIVAEATFGTRDDLYILSGFCRDKNGKILGGKSLAKLIPIGK